MQMHFPRKLPRNVLLISLTTVQKILLTIHCLKLYEMKAIGKIIRILTSPHLSVVAEPAKTRRKLPPESDMLRSFLLVSSSSVDGELFIFSSSFLLHGCQVDPTFSGMHIFEIGPCPTVRSKEIKPNNISSAQEEEEEENVNQLKIMKWVLI